MRLFGKNYKNQTDEELMQYVAKGDSTAFEELYDRYSTKLVNYFYRMLWKDQEKAEDFMQDLFTKIIHKPHQYNPERPFKTWVYSVANNMCKNEYRKQEIRKDTKYEYNENIQVSDGGIDFDKDIDCKSFNNMVLQELDQLKEEHKETFLLRYRDDLSIKEISEVLGCSQGTVKSRIFYTLKKLSETLKEYDPKQKELQP